MDNSTKETNNISKWLIPLNICMGIAIIALCGYIAHSEGYLNSLMDTKKSKTVVKEEKETEKEQKKEDEYKIGRAHV